MSWLPGMHPGHSGGTAPDSRPKPVTGVPPQPSARSWHSKLVDLGSGGDNHIDRGFPERLGQWFRRLLVGDDDVGAVWFTNWH